MQNEPFDLSELNQFYGTEHYFKHPINKNLVYTDGVQYLTEKARCYWLIDEIALTILPTLLKTYKDYFYHIQFYIHADKTADIIADDGNNNVLLKRKINVTNFPIQENLIKFYLCESDVGFCLMLPKEY